MLRYCGTVFFFLRVFSLLGSDSGVRREKQFCFHISGFTSVCLTGLIIFSCRLLVVCIQGFDDFPEKRWFSSETGHGHGMLRVWNVADAMQGNILPNAFAV